MALDATPYLLASLVSWATENKEEDFRIKKSEISEHFKTYFKIEISKNDVEDIIRLGEDFSCAKTSHDSLAETRIKFYYLDTERRNSIQDKIMFANISGSDTEQFSAKVLENYLDHGSSFIMEAMENLKEILSSSNNNPLKLSKPAPASDRIVTLQDNQQKTDILDGIEKIILEYQSDNEAGHDDERDAVLADLEAGKSLWYNGVFHYYSIKETLFKALNHIIDKVSSEVVKEASKKLLALLIIAIKSVS